MIWFVPTLFGLLALVFTISHIIPADPVAFLAGDNATNEQIADLELKAQGLNRKKRKAVNRQIESLKKVRASEINASNQIAQDLNDQVVEVDKQIQRLAKRRAEIKPSEAGSKARAARALRREEELAKEKDLILGLDRYAEGGYKINLTDDRLLQ